jgi:putative redox protein
MRTVKVAWEPLAERFVASGSARDQRLVIGAPRSDAGREAFPGATGFSATELLLAGAGACASWDMVEILRKQRQEVTGLEVEVDGAQAPDPPWEYRHITLRFRVVGRTIDRERAERAARLSTERYCSVLATLRGVSQVEWHLTIEEESSEPAA